MNRKQFMDELDRLLMDFPWQDRREAIQYYHNYFDDAGKENEAQAIQELGSPAQIAKTIRESMAEGVREEKAPSMHTSTPRPGLLNRKILWIVLLGILLSPILLLVATGILAFILGIGSSALILLLSALIIGAALPIAGVITILYGALILPANPAPGLSIAGIGCLFAGAGVLTCLFGLWFCRQAVPAMFRCVARLVSSFFRKAGVMKSDTPKQSFAASDSRGIPQTRVQAPTPGSLLTKMKPQIKFCLFPGGILLLLGLIGIGLGLSMGVKPAQLMNLAHYTP